MRKPLFVTLATGATLLVSGGVAVAMAGEPVSNTQAAITRQTASPTDEPSITPTARPSVSLSPSSRPAITRAQAEAIALRRVGGGQIESTNLEFEDGRLVWDVDLIRQGVKWEVEIDSRSGRVVEFKSDGNRDDRRDGRGDDHGDDRGGHHGDHHGDDDGDNSGPGSDNSGPGSGGDDGDDHGGHGSDD